MATGGRSGFVYGFLTGLLVAGIPFLLFLLRPAPTLVVRAPAPGPAGAEGALPAPGARPARPGEDAAKGEEPGATAPAKPAGGESEGGGTGTDPAAPGSGSESSAPEGESDGEEERERAYEEKERALVNSIKDHCTVRVVDAATGEPLPQVSFSLFLGSFGSGGSSSGTIVTGNDGTVDAQPRSLLRLARAFDPEDFPAMDRIRGSADDPFRAIFRFRVPGYRAVAVDATGEGVDVKLEPVRAPAPFGSVRGRLTGADGAPWTEPVVLSLQDPIVLDSLAFWVVPGPDGRYELSGVPAGSWGVKATDAWGHRTRVEIAPGGSAEADVPVAEGDRGDLPARRRPVAVQVAATDLPYGGAVLLQGNWGAPFCAAVQAGIASFPSVPSGAVTLILRRPDAEDGAPAAAVIPEGAGRLELRFP